MDQREGTDLPSVPPQNGGVTPPAPSLRKISRSQQTTADGLHRTTVVADLASHWDRLKARLIDGALPLCGLFLMELAGGEGLFAVLGILIIVALFVYQIYLLSTTGQTIGKRSVNIRVVKADTGEIGGFSTNVLMREGVNTLLAIIPFYSLVDILFIFRDDRRCIHDHLAGTRVVNA